MNNLIIFIFLCLSVTLYAQPVNDECEDLIDLGTLPFCATDTFFTNVDATTTNIGNDNVPLDCNPGGSWNFTGRDVWFSFVASDTIEDYTVTLNGIMDSLGGSPMTNPQIAIYRGECGFDELALLACARADMDGDNSIQFNLIGLDGGVQYYMRINDWSPTATPNSGSFILCLQEQDPINTIDQMGSTACSGLLFDSGGPDGDYSSNEDNSFTICPNAPFNSCVTFSLESYNLEANFDNLTFYDGPNTNSQVIDNLGGGGSSTASSAGGVCYSVQASSGCLTVGFTSTESTNFEGFAGMWECSSEPCSNPTPITVDDNIDETTIIDALTTSQTVVTVDTIICPQGGLGTFVAGDNTNLGLEKGLLLTTGFATNAVGPNQQAGTSQPHNSPGDADLDYFSFLNGGESSLDACVVELNVFVATNELRFEYIFGSEEYPEFVNSGLGVNDIFALLVKGPGIVGIPDIDNQENVAVIPGTNTFIEIDNVNSGSNWEYYRDNQINTATGVTETSVQYDGLTSDFLGVKKSLTASIPVIPCNDYKLKLAIADRGDAQFDSGVFVGELRGGVPNLVFDSNNDIDFLVEDCSGVEDEILVTLNNPLDDPQSYTVTLSGTATRNIDYILDMPDQIIISPGETQLSFSIIPITDMITEGNETIIISLSNDFGCGVVELENIVITILEEPLIEINLGADTALVCLADSSNSIALSATGATQYVWTPSNIFDDNNEPTVNATPIEDGYIYVTGQLGELSSCIGEDSIYIQRIDPQISIEVDGTTDICQGDTITLSAINNTDDLEITWTPENNLGSPESAVTTAFPFFNQTYVASVNVTGCVVTDTVVINVDDFDFPILIPDSTICQGSETILANPILFTSTTYSWTPAETLNDPTVANPTAIPQVTTTYIVTATSESDFCTRTDSVTITVIPAAIDISNDTTFLCIGDTARLMTDIMPTGFDITWSPDDGSISDVDAPNPFVYPTSSTTYFAILETTDCIIMDSVFIQVDSLPIIDTILLDSFKMVYCPGEVVTLTSPLYDPMNYPDIEHSWDPMQGQITPDSLFNLVIRTQVDTITYTRFTTNNACRSQVGVMVPVIRPEVLIVPDTTVCAGSPFQIFASTVDPTSEFEWMPEDGLSCADCPDPVVQVNSNTTFMVSTEVFGCPASGSYTTDLIQPPLLGVVPNQPICLGASITLNSGPQPGVTYQWTASDPAFSSNLSNPTVSPTVNTTYMLTASNAICPPVSDEVSIEVTQPVTFSVGEDVEACPDTPFELTATANPDLNPDFYEWIDPDNNRQSGSTIEAVLSSPGQYFYTVNFDNNCEQFSDEISVVVTRVEQVDSFSIDPFRENLEDCFDEGQLVNIAANVDSILGGSSYVWTQNNVATGSNSRSLETQVLTGDPVSFALQITTSNGCVTNSGIGAYCVNPARAAMPNAFSPNGPEPNNFFNIQTVGLYEEVETFRIWNRFGDLVYDNQNPTRGWDGRVDGKLAPSDVYLFHITIRKFTGVVEEFSGDVTLIR